MEITAHEANENFLSKNENWIFEDEKQKEEQFQKLLKEIKEYSFRIGYICVFDLFIENEIKFLKLGFQVKNDNDTKKFIIWNEKQFDMHLKNDKIIIG